MKLKKNCNIGVCAPADYIDKIKYKKAENYLKTEYNLNLVQGKNLFNKYGCFAGTDEQKTNDINEFLSDDNIHSIFFAKGGYGSAALLKNINYDEFKKHPKILMGYSDVTSILLSVYSKTNIPTFHGPMVTTEFSKSLHKLTAKSFKNMVLKNRKKRISFTEHETSRFEVIKSAKIFLSGTIIAGCLTIFNTLIGTPYLKIPDKSILFLEDTGEEAYRIDRQITHILNSGIFKKCSGLIIDFINYKSSGKNKETIPLKKRLLELFKDYDITIMFWHCFGHRKKKIILPIGQNITFDFNKRNCTIDIGY